MSQTVFTENFTRGDSSDVGNGWTEESYVNGDSEILSNACKLSRTGESSSQTHIYRTHGSLVTSATLSFKVSGCTGGGSVFLSALLYGNSGISIEVNKNSTVSYVQANGQKSNNFSYDFSAATIYAWVDYTHDGGNVKIDAYFNTTNSKPVSPTATKTSTNGIGIDDTLHFYLNDNGTGSSFSTSCILDDITITDASTPFTALTSYIYGLDNAGYIYRGRADQGDPLSDFVQRSQTQNWVSANKLSILQSMQGDVLWSSIQTSKVGVIGRIWTGVHDSSTSATILTDGSETFTGKVIAGDIIYNLTDGSSGTVTSCTGSTVTCTGGFTGGTDNQWENGDKYELYASEYQILTANTASSPTGTAASIRSRQMVNFEGTTYVLNDNYLESISSTLTYTAAFLQFHKRYIGECMAVNGNRLLICANYNGFGKTHLWNGFSTDYTYKLDLPDEIKAVTAYNDGWLLLCGGSIYFTDGFRLQHLSDLLDIREQDYFQTHINGFIVKDDVAMLSGGAANYDKEKTKTGVYYFKPSNHTFTYLPYAQGATLSLSGGTPGALFFEPIKSIVYSGYQTTTITNPYFIGTVEDGVSGKAMLIYPHDFNRTVNLKRVILEVEPEHNFGDTFVAPSITIRAGFSVLDDILWTYLNTNVVSTGTTNLNVDGTNIRSVATKGALVLNGSAGGSFDFITSIATPQTSTEAWTMDNALLGTSETGIPLNMFPFYKSEDITYTLSTTQNLQDFIFENIPAKAQYGRRFACLFYVSTTNFNFRIKAIHLDYEGAMK